jgi:hypothetical protein
MTVIIEGQRRDQLLGGPQIRSAWVQRMDRGRRSDADRRANSPRLPHRRRTGHEDLAPPSGARGLRAEVDRRHRAGRVVTGGPMSRSAAPRRFGPANELLWGECETWVNLVSQPMTTALRRQNSDVSDESGAGVRISDPLDDSRHTRTRPGSRPRLGMHPGDQRQLLL